MRSPGLIVCCCYSEAWIALFTHVLYTVPEHASHRQLELPDSLLFMAITLTIRGSLFFRHPCCQGKLKGVTGRMQFRCVGRAQLDWQWGAARYMVMHKYPLFRSLQNDNTSFLYAKSTRFTYRRRHHGRLISGRSNTKVKCLDRQRTLFVDIVV